MNIVRALARPMLASTFIYGGLDAVRNPSSKVGGAEKVTDQLGDALPVDLPDDTEQLVRINGAVQLGAGTLLALGKFPRLSALALAASLAPTTAAGHRFWEAPDDQTRTQHLVHFLKNVSMMGGLLIAALDTEGRPSLGWRASRASSRARDKAEKVAAQAAAQAERSRAAAAKAQTSATQGAVRGVGSLASSLAVGH